VLDRRLRSRRYGETFVRSLPDCAALRDVLLRDMPGEVSAWLHGRQSASRRECLAAPADARRQRVAGDVMPAIVKIVG
jgi:hypothetical protein